MPVTKTRTQILDAVLVCARQEGLGRLSVESVAAQAGVSRQTVYRHFASRHQLIEETILREERDFIDRMLVASSEASDLDEAVAAAVGEALRLAREHPVLNRLMESDPASLLPYLLLGRGPVISAAEPAVEELLRRHRPNLALSRLRLVADMTTRLLVSYVVSRNEDISDNELATTMGAMVVTLTAD